MSEPPPRLRCAPRFAGLAYTLGLRLAAWGGALALVLLCLGDLRFALPHWSARRAGPSPPGMRPSPPSPGADWPHLRGPRYSGESSETDLAESWPVGGPPLVWRRHLGQGYSALVAVGDRVYTQRQDLAAQSLVCLEAATGDIVWETPYDWPHDAAGMYPGPRATPTYCEGSLYFVSPGGTIGAVRADDGAVRWKVDVQRRFRGRGLDFGHAASPLVLDGKVIVPVGGKGAALVALSTDDGAVVWAAGDEPASYASPIPIVLQGRTLVVAFLQNAVTVVDPETGRPLWVERWSSGYDEHAAQPLYDEPLLIVASPFKAGAEAFALRFAEPDAAAAPGESAAAPPRVLVDRLWLNPKLSNDTASSLLYQRHVYGFDLREVQARAHRPSRGEYRCLDARTGAIRWSTDRTGHATGIVADGKLYLFGDRGEAVLARATPKHYEELGRATVFTGEVCWTAPTLRGGRLFLRSPRQAACLDVSRRGATRLPAPTGTATAAPPAATVAPVDWTWLVGGEREFPLDPPSREEFALWLGWMYAALAASAGVALAVAAVLHRLRCASAGSLAMWVLWGTALLLSGLLAPWAARLSGAMVFTWPLGLYAAAQLALMGHYVARQPRCNVGSAPTLQAEPLPPEVPPRGASTPAAARAAGVAATASTATATAAKWWRMLRQDGLALCCGYGVLVACLLYFQGCRRLGLAPLWAFLPGLLPACLAAVPAAAWAVRRPRPVRDVALAVLGFSWYCAACATYIAWQT